MLAAKLLFGKNYYLKRNVTSLSTVTQAVTDIFGTGLGQLTAKMATRLFHWGCFVLAFLGFKYALAEPFQAPTFTINLDLEPEQRWVNVTKKYAHYSLEIVAGLRKLIPKFAFPLAEKLAVSIAKHFPEPYPAEMKGISKALNISLADTILLNILYDLTAFCTSIVAQDKEGNIFHGRNLDYDFSEVLRNTSFISNFQSKGKSCECFRQETQNDFSSTS